MTSSRLQALGSFIKSRRLRSIPCALFPLAIVSACSSLQGGAPERGSATGFANLSVLIESELAGSGEWGNLSSRRRRAQSRADELASGAAMQPTDRDLFSEFDEISRQESRLKKNVYPGIYAAVKNVAKRRKIDFVLSMDDGLLYAESAYDITGEVLQELKTIRARSDPLVR